MGRYRAPQVDEDDDGQEVFPMDWDVIPDDVAEDHAVGSNFARIGRRDDDDDGRWRVTVPVYDNFKAIIKDLL